MFARFTRIWAVAGAAAALTGAAAGASAPSTERVALAADGTQPDADVFYQASITSDARFVVFASDSATLAPGAAGGIGPFVYVRDRSAGTTELVSRGGG